MAWTFANFAETTLSSGVDDTVTTWTVADGSIFPATGDFIVRCGTELAKCTSRSTNDLTVVRGSESTTAAAHSSSDPVYLVISKAILDSFARTITGTSNRVTVTNGDGISGAPTLDISSSYAGQNTIATLGTVTTGTWWGSTIAVGYGGTGATDTVTARANLGLEIGAQVQAYDADLTAIAIMTGTGFAVRTTTNTWTQRTVTGTSNRITVTNGDGVSGNPVVDVSSSYVGQSTITTLGTVTTGTWTGTAIAVANGGTGSTNASDARTALGLAIGTNVQAYDAELAAIAGLTSAADKLPYFSGSGTAGLADFTAGARAITALAGLPGICGFRLTLESGVPVSTTDQLAKTTLYLTPDPASPWCGLISNYESSNWLCRKFSAVSLSLSGYTTGKPYDIFAYVTGGVLTLESVVWTNDTTRATALATQDSRYVKTSAADRLYVGTIYTSATGQCEDSLNRRLVWNCYNRVIRPVRTIDTTNSWTYASTTVRQARATATNQVDGVFGLARSTVSLSVIGANTPGATTEGVVGIGIDSTTVDSSTVKQASYNNATNTVSLASLLYSATVGYHYFPWLEYRGAGSATVTYFGDGGGVGTQSGIYGSWEC